MDIIVGNEPSPGASFTEHTKNSVINYFRYCKENSDKSFQFTDLRKNISFEKKTNEKNDRCIWPLLKNLGFVNYQKGEMINCSKVFTNKGIALTKLFELEKNLNKNNIAKERYDRILYFIKKAIEELVFNGLWHIVKDKKEEVSYSMVIIQTIRFLIKYNSYDKKEFCYMLYCFNKKISTDKVTNTVLKYRKNIIDFMVYADTYDKKSGSAQNRKKTDISNITCYGYISNLLEAAGIVKKVDKSRYELREENKEKIQTFLYL